MLERLLRWMLNGLYLGVIGLVMPVLLYRRWRFGKYRTGWGEKLLGRVPLRAGNRPCLWLHAVSVGEVLQIQPVINAWRQRHPDWDIAITTTTPTGKQVAEREYPDCLVSYCPLDFTWAVQQAFARIRPSMLGLVELELWPNLILEARRQQAPLVLINGRLSERSFRGYRKLRRLLQPLWNCFQQILVQNAEYAARFEQLGIPANHLQIAGSIKFDRLQTDRNSAQVNRLRQILQIPAAAPVLMAGSTHAPEEETVLEHWQDLRLQFPDLRLILAPRHAERFDEVAELVTQQGLPLLRRSQRNAPETSTALSEPSAAQPETAKVPLSTVAAATAPQATAVCLLDTLGELSACWGLADLAFVGGSWSQRGGQNMMEPAAFGCAVLLGPNTWNFAEVVADLQAEQACRIVQNGAEFGHVAEELLRNRLAGREMGLRAQKLVLSRQGATALTISALEQAAGVKSPEKQLRAA